MQHGCMLLKLSVRCVSTSSALALEAMEQGCQTPGKSHGLSSIVGGNGRIAQDADPTHRIVHTGAVWTQNQEKEPSLTAMELGIYVPWLRPEPGPFLGPFRQNIHEFLQQYGTRVSLGRCMKKITAWIVRLEAESGCKVLLHVYEERYGEEKDTQPSCDCCRNMGESFALQHEGFSRSNVAASQDGKTTLSTIAPTTSSSREPKSSVIP